MPRTFLHLAVWLSAACTPETKTPTPCVPQEEIPYDGIDQNCTGTDLDDVDDDGFSAPEVGGDDCNDSDRLIHPDSVEIPYDGIDQDCSQGDLIDADDDSFVATEAGGDDCDDNDVQTYPGAPDVVGEGDQNCDGVDGEDSDGDGYAAGQGGGTDCDDTDPEIYPNAAEIWYDGIDQNCDQYCDFDQDGDGATAEGAVVLEDDWCDDFEGPGVATRPDCDDTDAALIDFEIFSMYPLDGASGIPTDAEVRIGITGLETGVDLVVEDPLAPVPGVVTIDYGLFVVFTPSTPLASGTIHTITLTHSCGVDIFTFTTQ